MYKRNSFKDLTGQKFNRWTVLRVGKRRTVPCGQTKTYWICQCDCGTIKEIYSHSLISGKSKTCYCSLRKNDEGHTGRNSMFSCYKTKCKRQNIEFSITLEQFGEMTKQNCYYCGSEPSNKVAARNWNGDYIYNGIDRVDNNLGYIDGNMVPCCKNCNLAKRQLSKEQFLNMIKMIYERHLK